MIIMLLLYILHFKLHTAGHKFCCQYGRCRETFIDERWNTHLIFIIQICVERKWVTVVGMSQNLLKQSGLPNKIYQWMTFTSSYVKKSTSSNIFPLVCQAESTDIFTLVDYCLIQAIVIKLRVSELRGGWKQTLWKQQTSDATKINHRLHLNPQRDPNHSAGMLHTNTTAFQCTS